MEKVIYKCPEENCKFHTDDLGYFVEHVSSMNRNEFVKHLLVKKELVLTVE